MRAVMVRVPHVPMAFVADEFAAPVDVAAVYGSATAAGEGNKYYQGNKGG